ncbi:NF038129 family PEP-CTERM protein [uncultured Massilia sp.]|uniref:NF038129 family PEP-CTERM protein n=1 Tax=uncultured Massilia sp. TaxID=169973 RepID=UPI00258477AB|nr:NF038129 family PEP-CTERM protein [uncultured Massilia sp.]
MRNLMKRFSLCLFALALFASNAAQALPTYQVKVDTRGLSGTALMDFTFLANAGATPAHAILSNFSGAFGDEYERSAGVTGNAADGLVLGNQDGGDWLTRYVLLGGWFSFDVSFEGAFATTEGVDATLFNASLYTEDFSDYIGTVGSFAAFSLLPQVDGVPGAIVVSAADGLATVAQVPEPSSLLLVLLAFGALAWTRRNAAQCESAHGARLAAHV